MPQPLSHLYDLALRALDEQERRTGELRGRLAPVLAAAGLGTTLLTGPALRGGHARGGMAVAALVVALFGLLGALCGAGYLLTRSTEATKVDPRLAGRSVRTTAEAR